MNLSESEHTGRKQSVSLNCELSPEIQCSETFSISVLMLLLILLFGPICYFFYPLNAVLKPENAEFFL